MAEHRFRPQVEILAVTDTGRRRRWTDAEKVRIVEESFGALGQVAETARRHDVGRSLLVRWRRQYRDGVLTGTNDRVRFAPLTVSEPVTPSVLHAAPAPEAPRPEPVEITLTNGRRLSVTSTIDPVALARLVSVLDPA